MDHMQFDILQNKRIIGAPYCFCLLKRIFQLTLWSLAGTRIWNLGPDFFPPLLSQKTNDATVNSFTTTHFSLDIWCTAILVFWSTENLFSQIYMRGNSYLVWQTLQFKIFLWRPWPGYETHPVLHVLWIKTFWRSSATCQGEVEGEGGFPGTPSLPSKSQGAHRLSHCVYTCANSAETKQTKTLRSRGFWCPAGLQSFHVKQSHALVRAYHPPDEESQTLMYVPSFKYFNSPVKCCRVS